MDIIKINIDIGRNLLRTGPEESTSYKVLNGNATFEVNLNQCFSELKVPLRVFPKEIEAKLIDVVNDMEKYLQTHGKII